MASVSNAWDLQASSAPRSICVFKAPPTPNQRGTNQSLNNNNPFEQRKNSNTSTNPFDNAARALSPSKSSKSNGNNEQDVAKYAIVFGTEGGALHYRTYPQGSLGLGDMTGRRIGGSAGGMSKIPPLGSDYNPAALRSGSATNNFTPSIHQPVDLPNAVSGAVIGMIQATFNTKTNIDNLNNLNSLPFETFLLLIDDNRGSAPSSSSSPGTYATQIISLKFNLASSSSQYTPKLNNTNTFSKLNISLPRMSAATFHPNCGFVYAAGTSIMSLGSSIMDEIFTTASSSGYSRSQKPSLHPAFLKMNSIQYTRKNSLPSNIRAGGNDALALVCQGYAAVVSVNNNFYAVAPNSNSNTSASNTTSMRQIGEKKSDSNTKSGEAVKLLSLNQSSVHPVVILEVKTNEPNFSKSPGNIISSLLFLASGRECAMMEVNYSQSPVSMTNASPITSRPTRHGIITFPSPILAASSTLLPSSRVRRKKNLSPQNNTASENDGNNISGAAVSLLAILTADGTTHIRSPSCMSVPLCVLDVGSRPNNFFTLKNFPKEESSDEVVSTKSKRLNKAALMAVGYSGDARIIMCREDSSQEQADRIMRLSIDAFGADNFPRKELAEALNSSFSAASHVGPEPTSHSRSILCQYLEVALGLTDESYGENLFLPLSDNAEYNDVEEDSIIPHGAFDALSLNESSGLPAKTHASPFYVAGTALLCLVCTQIPNAQLANRAAKTCASRIKITSYSNYPESTSKVCEAVVDRLLNFASVSVSLLQHSTQKIESKHKGTQKESNMEFMEAALWLLRCCGRHEKAMFVLQERMSIAQKDNNPSSYTTSPSLWSPIKFESYTAAHLGELFSSEDEYCTKLVLRSKATNKLLEQNPVLGLSAFMSDHPRNDREWREFHPHKDPLGTKAACVLVSLVIELLKGIEPRVSQTVGRELDMKNSARDDEIALPLDTGNTLAITYLESAIGISSGKPISVTGEGDVLDLLPAADGVEEHIESLHDELVYLLLEGVVSEMRGDEDESKRMNIDISESDTKLGQIFREKLRRILSWPMAKYRADRVLDSLPSSFLREHALLLGRLGKHEEALKILYCDLKSLDLALEYCDIRYDRQVQLEKVRQKRQMKAGFSPRKNYNPDGTDCAYLPLVKVALESSSSQGHRGTSAAIQVLALRRHAIDRGAALRLLPDSLPMSAVARPFLIPALVDSESQVRRLTVTASLLRAKYISLKHALTEAQIKSQSDLASIPALQSLNLGSSNPIHSSRPYKARSSSAASSTFPDVTITKHFFPRHMIIQVQVTNSAPALQGRTLGDVAFFVAESSDEAAVSPSNKVPIQTLPYNATGCAWCAMVAFPTRIDGAAILTCELRYTVLSVDTATGAPLHFSGSGVGSKGRTYVEELQDIEVRSRDFESSW